LQVDGFFSNSVPTDAYRGAGGPERRAILEQLADKAARELGIDRAGDPASQPDPVLGDAYKTPVGPTYGCGDFPKVSRERSGSRTTPGLPSARNRVVALHRLLHRILRRRALADSGGDERASGFCEVAQVRASPGRQRHGVPRNAQPPKGTRRRSPRSSRILWVCRWRK
jgi:hypothetical protein